VDTERSGRPGGGRSTCAPCYHPAMDDGFALKEELVSLLKQAGAWSVGFASPLHGFTHAVPGHAPLEVWPACRSVVCFAVAMSPLMNNTYMGPCAPFEDRTLPAPVPAGILSDSYAMNRLARLFGLYVESVCMAFLESRGWRTTFHQVPRKLAAVAAGLGVYGRSGLVIHPDLGSRLCLGAVMTDAEMPPDSPLDGFDPCQGCSVCIEGCPAGAYDPALEYPESWDRGKCTGKRAELELAGLYCHNCLALCPAGTVEDRNLLSTISLESIAGGSGGR
jgi:hypothetical protein